MTTVLLSSFLLGPVARMFLNLTMCLRVISPQTGNHSWSCRTSILEDVHFSQNELIQVSFEKILAGSWRHSSTGTFSSGVSVSRRQVWSRVLGPNRDNFHFIPLVPRSLQDRILKMSLQSSCLPNWLRVREESKVFPNIYSISISTSHWRVTLTLHYDSYRRDLLLSVCVDHYKIFQSFSTLRCQGRSSSSGKYTMQYANHLRIRIFIFRIHEHFLEFLLWVSVSVMDSQVVTFNFFYPFRRLEDNYIHIN